jgi:hypothetical protein
MWIIVNAHVDYGNVYASHTPEIFLFLFHHTLAATWLMLLLLISAPNTTFDIYIYSSVVDMFNCDVTSCPLKKQTAAVIMPLEVMK